MTQQALDALGDTLAAIPEKEVRSPNIPAMETVVEARQTVELVRQDKLVAEQLGKVGVDDAALDAVELAAKAAERAEILCRYVLFGVKSEEAQARVALAERVRGEVLAAARFNLRRDRKAMATIRGIAQGRGLLDLSKDLGLCDEFLVNYEGAFDADETFDAAEALKQCRALKSELDAMLSSQDDALARQRALDLRNRAWTHLDDLLDDLREAGRYALRAHPKLRRAFASAYTRRANSRRAR
jgi:hypothetical protein